jgi:hypothetical protein
MTDIDTLPAQGRRHDEDGNALALALILAYHAFGSRGGQG